MALVSDTRVKVLVADPELGLRIPAAKVTDARQRLLAPVVELECGPWDLPTARQEVGHLGFLILDGLLARDLVLAGSLCTELLGEGDVIQPWVASSEDRLLRFHVQWRVLEPVRLAVLDEEFAQTATNWPQVGTALLERAVRRTVRQSVHQALLQLSPVETRLLVLFWYLAERWGRVTPAGIVVPLRLPHQLLGQLVGCQRTSVTTALKQVSASGMLVRRSDGSWLLHGRPPDEFLHMRWHRDQPASVVPLSGDHATPRRNGTIRKISAAHRA